MYKHFKRTLCNSDVRVRAYITHHYLDLDLDNGKFTFVYNIRFRSISNPFKNKVWTPMQAKEKIPDNRQVLNMKRVKFLRT